MKLSTCLVVLLGAVLATGQASDDFLYDTFPNDFLWSTATSSYQIEGGWNADGETVCLKLHLVVVVVVVGSALMAVWSKVFPLFVQHFIS